MKISYLIRTRGTRSISAILWSWIYLPHLLAYFFGGAKKIVDSDLDTYRNKIKTRVPRVFSLLYLLHNNIWFRTSFYYRIGPIWSWLISWWRLGDKSFIIFDRVEIGAGFHLDHSYSSVLNAKRIGKNFHCINGVTIGNKNGKRPIIGDNVKVFANAVIIGDVRIGNNVTIGAGSVVVKDIPDNAVVVGNPARIIKYNEPVQQ